MKQSLPLLEKAVEVKKVIPENNQAADIQAVNHLQTVIGPNLLVKQQLTRKLSAPQYLMEMEEMMKKMNKEKNKK